MDVFGWGAGKIGISVIGAFGGDRVWGGDDLDVETGGKWLQVGHNQLLVFRRT